MATIKGTTTDIIGSLVARILVFTQIQDVIGSVSVGNPTRVISNSNTGRFSIVLAQGDYVVDIGTQTSAFVITVPSGTGEYEIGSLIRNKPTSVRVFTTYLGDGSTTLFTVNHTLNTIILVSAVYKASSPYDQVMPNVSIVSPSSVMVSFINAPTTNEFLLYLFS